VLTAAGTHIATVRCHSHPTGHAHYCLYVELSCTFPPSVSINKPSKQEQPAFGMWEAEQYFQKRRETGSGDVMQRQITSHFSRIQHSKIYRLDLRFSVILQRV